MNKAFAASLVAVSLFVAVGCGDDDDDDDGDSANTGTTTEQAGQQPFPHLAEAASRLEGYLKDGKRGQVISYVEAADGELKVWTRLNAAAATDEKAAREICQLAAKSGVPEAQDAVVVDAGAEEFPPCDG